MIPTATITPLLILFVRWAATQDQVLAVALVGSFARNEARPDSDVDLIVITPDPHGFRQTAWVHDLRLELMGATVSSWADEDYGALWSRRIVLSTGRDVEVGFAARSWAAIDPIDTGTLEVARAGMRILFDPSGLLHQLRDACDQGR